MEDNKSLLEKFAEKNNNLRELEEVKETAALFKAVSKPPENNKIPYYVFKCIFADKFEEFFKLPSNMTTEERLSPDVQRIGEAVNHWVGLAGGFYREVDLVDDNNNVIDTVPSVTIRPNINGQEGKPFNTISKQYILKNNRLKVEGERYLTNELRNFQSTMEINDVDTKAHREKWMAVIKKYKDESPEEKLDKTVPVNEPTKEVQEQLDINYDDD